MILLALAPFLLPLGQEPTPAAAAQPQLSAEATAIRAACAKLAEAPNYTFKHLMLEEGSGFGRGRADDSAAAGVGPPPPPPPAPVPFEFTAHVQRDLPVHFLQGNLEAWRKDGVLVWRNAAGAWERMEARGGRGGAGGGAAGGEPQDEQAQRDMRSRMSLVTAQSAHEMLKDFETKIAMVARTEEGGKSVYTGSLTPEGAASMAGGGRFGRGGNRGGGAAAFVNTGSFRFVVSADGVLDSFTLDTLMTGSIEERKIERKRHAEYRFSVVGTTKLEVPAEVTAKFSEKPKEGVEF